MSAIHSTRCAQSHPKNRCRCSCGGRFHAIDWGPYNRENNEKFVSTAFGGDVAALLTQYEGKRVQCHCGAEFVVAGVMGREHPDGVVDAYGHRWRVWASCPDCHEDVLLQNANVAAPLQHG
jgi:hypothetical protein